MKEKPPIKDDYRRSLLYVASQTNNREAMIVALVIIGGIIFSCLHSCLFSP